MYDYSKILSETFSAITYNYPTCLKNRELPELSHAHKRGVIDDLASKAGDLYIDLFLDNQNAANEAQELIDIYIYNTIKKGLSESFSSYLDREHPSLSPSNYDDYRMVDLLSRQQRLAGFSAWDLA